MQEPKFNPLAAAFIVSCCSLLCSPVLAFFNTSPKMNLTIWQILTPTVFGLIVFPVVFVVCLVYELFKKE
jgi:hypothetical protein